jgi:hypothetical protein
MVAAWSETIGSAEGDRSELAENGIASARRMYAAALDERKVSDVKKFQFVAMVGALSVAAASNATANESPLFPNAPKTITQACAAKAGSSSSSDNALQVSKPPAGPKLNPEYIKIQTFSAFRKKIIEDCWTPVPNPECHDAVFGASYDSYCSKEPDSIGCRLCTMVPEVFRSTSDGYNLMRYTKDGVPLSVTVYGDVNDLDAPGRYGLIVVGWDYSMSLNVILLDN